MPRYACSCPPDSDLCEVCGIDLDSPLDCEDCGSWCESGTSYRDFEDGNRVRIVCYDCHSKWQDYCADFDDCTVEEWPYDPPWVEDVWSPEDDSH